MTLPNRMASQVKTSEQKSQTKDLLISAILALKYSKPLVSSKVHTHGYLALYQLLLENKLNKPADPPGLALNQQTLRPSRPGVKPADAAALQDWS